MLMTTRYRLFKRNSGIFFIQDNVSGKQESLRTRDKDQAKRLFAVRNEANVVLRALESLPAGDI